MKVKQGKADLTSTGGNVVAGHVLTGVDTHKHLPDFQHRRADAISDHDILMTMVGMLANGRTDFCDVELYRYDEVFKQSYGIKRLPSESTLRNRFDEFPLNAEDAIRKLSTSLLKEVSFGQVEVGALQLTPLDMDVSCMDNSGSHKKGCSYTYTKCHGFSPNFAYIGTEGFMLNAELRPGSQHCQNGTPEFIEKALAQVKQLGLQGHILCRLDSGNDACKTISTLKDELFIVKRNLRKESPEQWLDMARCVGVLETPREGKNVYWGTVEHKVPGGDDTQPACPIAFRVIERTSDHEGNRFLIPEVEVETYWTNLLCSAQRVVELYHAHGTSEQFHSELKSDMDVERLPSGDFYVNRLILLCGMVSFNILRTIGQKVIARASLAKQKITVARWRLKTVLQNIIYCAARIVRHAGRVELHFGRNCPWFAVIDDMLKT